MKIKPIKARLAAAMFSALTVALLTAGCSDTKNAQIGDSQDSLSKSDTVAASGRATADSGAKGKPGMADSDKVNSQRSGHFRSPAPPKP
jgi:hypothetical protein